MDAKTQSTSDQQGWKAAVTPRVSRAQWRERAERIGFWWQSRRQVARTLGVPDSSFRHCLRRHEQRCQASRFSRRVVAFCESPEGLEFLRCLLVALHLVFVQANDAGLRNISWFLHLSGLDEFLPASYGWQQAFAAEMEAALAEFGREEEQRLAAQMPPQEISLCEDETFHPQICLVAIEPVSDYLLLEQYAPQRDAATWNQALDERLAGWSVTVRQVTSDEAKALIAHAEKHLGAQHSPDLFHVQHETIQATGLALAGQTRRAHQAVADAAQQTTTRHAELAACQEQCPQSTHVAEAEQQVAQATAMEASARERLVACQRRQAEATAARQGLSHDYHPFDLETGRPVSADEVGERLSGHFDRLEQVVQEAGLSLQAREKVAKARRVLPAMRATMAFFWVTVAEWLAAWPLSETVRLWLREQLLPGLYLERAAEKLSTAAKRRQLRTRAAEILARARSPDGVWGTLSATEQTDLEAKARQCVNLFQRSSSCVEGRNGQLSLRHHGLHRLTTKKLGALRVLHNFQVTRPDGTTAAERFFGVRPRPLFPWLVARLRLPEHPRTTRRAT